MRNVPVAALVLLSGLLAACGNPAPSDRIHIAVIPKGTTHEFWQSVHAGAGRPRGAGRRHRLAGPAARGRSRRADLRGRERRRPRRRRASCSRRSTKRRWCGRSSAPAKRSIPVVIFDSGLKGDDYVSFVATDNDAGGSWPASSCASCSAARARSSCSATPRVTTAPPSARRASSTAIAPAPRHQGRELEPVRRRRRRRRLQDERSRSSASTRSPTAAGIDGIFAPNESTPSACCACSRTTAGPARCKFVGFDASAKLVKALRDGADRRARRAGPGAAWATRASKTLCRTLKGEQVERRIDTGVALVTPRRSGAAPTSSSCSSPISSQ